MGIGENMQKGYSDGVKMYELAGDNFAKGNWLGGLYDGALATFSMIGNTITLGAANAGGTEIYNTIDEKTDVVVDENTGDVSYRLVGGQKDLNFLEKLVMNEATSVATSDQYASRGNLVGANVIGGVDLALLALEFTPVGLAGSAGRAGAKALTAGGKALAACGRGAKAGLKSLATNGLKITAQNATKTAGAAIAKSASKVASAATKVVSKESLKNVGLSAIKTTAKAAGIYNLETITGQRTASYVDNVAEEGFASATKQVIQQHVADTAQAVGETAGAVVGVVGGGIIGTFMSKHKNIAKLVNTVRAAVSATADTCAKTTVGSYCVAALSAATQKVKSFLSDSTYAYEGKSISRIAEEIRHSNAESGSSWSASYIKYVKEFDKAWDVDSSKRNILVNPTPNPSGGCAEPSYG